MISARLVELIQNHPPQLTSDTVDDLLTNARTPSFKKVPRLDVESRIFWIFNHLGDCIAAGQTVAEDEFEEWGRRRFGQGIPLSEIVYSVILVKAHLSRYIRDHGLIDAAFPRTEAEYVLPMHLHSLQELNRMVGVMRLFPGISAQVLRNMLQPPLEGLVLETYGAGNAPDNDPLFLAAIAEACLRGVVIVNARNACAALCIPRHTKPARR